MHFLRKQHPLRCGRVACYSVGARLVIDRSLRHLLSKASRRLDRRSPVSSRTYRDHDLRRRRFGSGFPDVAKRVSSKTGAELTDRTYLLETSTRYFCRTSLSMSVLPAHRSNPDRHRKLRKRELCILLCSAGAFTKSQCSSQCFPYVLVFLEKDQIL